MQSVNSGTCFAFVVVALVCAALSACSSRSEADMGPTSPCVGNSGAPCDRQPLNVWRA